MTSGGQGVSLVLLLDTQWTSMLKRLPGLLWEPFGVSLWCSFWRTATCCSACLRPHLPALVRRFSPQSGYPWNRKITKLSVWVSECLRGGAAACDWRLAVHTYRLPYCAVVSLLMLCCLWSSSMMFRSCLSVWKVSLGSWMVNLEYSSCSRWGPWYTAILAHASKETVWVFMLP